MTVSNAMENDLGGDDIIRANQEKDIEKQRTRPGKKALRPKTKEGLRTKSMTEEANRKNRARRDAGSMQK